MLKATTLVHKGAVEIAVHSIRSFAKNFSQTHSLSIHTDPSTDDNDHRLLLEAANGMQARVVTAKDRGEKLKQILSAYPKTKELLSHGGFLTKFEIPMFEEAPYFFFDSDIVWLRPVANMEPANAANAFSTESWSWYPGVASDRPWIEAKTPRRVNSGFYYLSQPFPYKKLEEMLEQGIYDRSNPDAGDQEIFAYLFNDMEYYHPEDLKRSRVGSIYQLQEENCAALHFPGRMWAKHLDQIRRLSGEEKKPVMSIRYQPPVPLSAFEFLQMRMLGKLGKSMLLAKPFNLMRKLRR